jgi:hypothetical protein
MTVSSGITKHVYAGSGNTRLWPYTFPIIDATDIKIYLTSPTGEISEVAENYSIDTDDQAVTYPTVESELPMLPVGWEITLLRSVPITQETDYQNQGDFNAEGLEGALDKVTMIVQQQQEQLDRSVKYPVNETPSDDDTNTFLSVVNAAKADAQTAATAAENSETAAASSEAAALVAKQDAETASAAAAGHALTAETHKNSAATSAATAETHKDSAAGSATAAAASASTAETHKNSAAVSESNAAVSEQGAEAYYMSTVLLNDNANTKAAEAAASAAAALASEQAAQAYVEQLNFTSGVIANRPATPAVGDWYWATDEDKQYKCKVAGTWEEHVSGGGGGFPVAELYADQMETPNNADWAVNSLAPTETDPVNSGKNVLSFDDTTPEGRGYPIKVPANATSMILRIIHRAKTAPGSPATVMVALHHRDVPNNAAVGSWSAYNLDNITLPANAYFQYTEYTIPLATIGLTAGMETQLELVRRADQAGDNLVGDWFVRKNEITWS